jgi:trimeric autotransporter adhesin
MLVGLPTAEAADTVLTLACKGTVTETVMGEEKEPEPISVGLIFNFTKRSVQGFGDGVEIKSWDEVSVRFGHFKKDPVTKNVDQSMGTIDRITGDTNVAAGINPTDAVNVSQLTSLSANLQSQIGGLQSQVNDNDRRLRDGVAVAMAAGGVPAVPYGRKFGMFGNIATYDGHGAAGFGMTGVLLDTPNYQVQANGSFGVGFDTSVVGGRGGVAVFW